MGSSQRLIYTFALVAISFAARAQDGAPSSKTMGPCVMSTAENTAFVNIAFNYASLQNELKIARLAKQQSEITHLALAGTKNDQAFFADLGERSRLNPKSFNDWNTTIPDKKSFVQYLKNNLGPEKQFVFLNYSGHGLHFPVIENGRVTHFEWGMLLPVAGSPEDIMACVQTMFGFVKSAKTSAPNVKDYNQAKLIKASKECEKFVLTNSEINAIIADRPSVGIIDSCYAGAFGKNHCPSNQIFALSSQSTETSQEAELTRELDNKFYAHLKANSLSEVAQLKSVFTEINAIAPTNKLKAYIESNNVEPFYELARDAEGTEEILGSIMKNIDAAIKKSPKSVDLKHKARTRDLINKLIEKVSHSQEYLGGLQENNREQFTMGHLTNHLRERDFSLVDKNKDGQITVAEYFSDLPKAFDDRQHPQILKSKTCDDFFLDRVLFDVGSSAYVNPEIPKADHVIETSPEHQP